MQNILIIVNGFIDNTEQDINNIEKELLILNARLEILRNLKNKLENKIDKGE